MIIGIVIIYRGLWSILYRYNLVGSVIYFLIYLAIHFVIIQ